MGAVGSGQAPDPTLVGQIQDEAAQAQATAQANDPEDPGTGGINPRTVQAKLHAAQVATGAATGPGFEFTPEQVGLQLRHCEGQINDLRWDLGLARQAVAAVHEPAPDPASVAQADAVRNMLESTFEVINADIAYLTDWQNKLLAAKQNYMTTENLSEQQWTRLSQGLQA
jgi:hypothetical protein